MTEKVKGNGPTGGKSSIKSAILVKGFIKEKKRKGGEIAP